MIDGDGKDRDNQSESGLQVVFWSRYEIENYFITPEVLREYAMEYYRLSPQFSIVEIEIQSVLDNLILERVFKGSDMDMNTWKSLRGDAARLVWDTRTERVKLSDFAEEFFRRLAEGLGDSILLRKGELYKLVRYIPPRSISAEVKRNLDILSELLCSGTGR